jgi:hypothetical protein
VEVAFDAIARALIAPGSPLAGDAHVYAYGSHVNRTNIHAADPLDIVVADRTAVVSDLSALNDDERYACTRGLESDAPSVDEFATRVEHALRSAFGFGRGRVDGGNLAIVVTPCAGLPAAHIVVAAQYRRYIRFHSFVDQQFVDGIAIRGRRDGLQWLRFPGCDRRNSEDKDRATRGAFRRAVRMLKHARGALVERGLIESREAPSYALESLLFNLPDDRFSKDAIDTFYNILEWLERRLAWNTLVFQHHQEYLFGPSVWQWDLAAARRFSDALTRIWME